MESKNTSEKKITFEDLSKEELVKKCKTFLTIVQKAKQTKCLLQAENEQLKTKLESSLNREVPPAINELVQDLTQQKLNFVSTIEDLKLKNESLVNNLKHHKDEKKRLDVELNKIDSENISYKRQVTRLSDENEQLISHLESLEKQIEELNKIGLEQQKQLLALEESNINLESNSKQNEKIQELEKMLSISLSEIKKMKNERESKMDKLEMDSNEECKSNCRECNRLGELSDKNEKFKEKLRNYHSKIVKLANNIKQLKEDKEMLLDQFKIYTDQVTDWKDKLNIASEKLAIFVKNCDKETEELKKNNQLLKDMNARFMEQLEAHKTDDEKSKELEEMDTLKMKNSKLTEELEKSRDTLNELALAKESDVKVIEDEKNQLKAKLSQLCSENVNLSQSIIEEKQQHQTYVQQLLVQKEFFLKVDEEKNQLKENTIKYHEEICLLNEQIENLKNKITELNEEKTVSNEKLKLLEKSENDQKQCIMKLEQKVSNLNEELEKSLATEKQLAEKSGEEMLKLVQEVETLTEKCTKLQEQIEEYHQKEERSNCKLVHADIQTENEFIPTEKLEEEVHVLKSENSQLLTEMHEMNQELKERGENLSKLEAHCEEIKKKIQIHEAQANKNVNNITEKEEIIKELRAEVESLKIGNGTVNSLEKDEEMRRLKNEIEALQEKVNANNDSNYAESDIMSTSTISRTEEMDRLKDLEGSWEEKYSKLRNLAIKLKAKLKEQTTEFGKEKTELQQKLNNNYDTLKTLQTQNDQLEGELENTKKKCIEYSKKLESYEGNNNWKEEQIIKLKLEIEDLKKDKSNTETWKKQIAVKVQALRKELQEKEASKRDYDLKLAKLTADLEAKEQALKLEIENHKQTRNSLQHSTYENKKNTVLNLEMQDYEKSVKDLSQKLERKNENITKLKGQVDSQKGVIKTLREEISTLEEKIGVYENDLDTAVNDMMAYKNKTIELEKNLQIKDEEILNINQQLETTRSQNEELSTELSKDIAKRQKIINTLGEEKEMYYLQNLNLQQTSRDLQQKLSLKEEEFSTLSNEYENYKIRAQSVFRQNQSRDIGLEEKLSGNVSSLTSQVEALNSEMNELRNLNQALQKENEMLKTDQNILSTRCEENLLEKNELKDRYDQLITKYNQALNEHNETVRSLKVHAETLGQCYRQQLSEQEVRHNREIVELQSKIEKAPSPTEIALPTLLTMPREEGEGSESIESVNNLPVPLEKLLADEEDQKINTLKKQINEQESKLTHLTELLADTEQDLVKHVQMNKVLKEEIRRQQRAVEREKHAENLEYLKNVVFKFITLNSGDERSRLVPVLNTILKLSPEEARKLDLVAKGDPGLKAWSSYLPMWSSPNKP